MQSSSKNCAFQAYGIGDGVSRCGLFQEGNSTMDKDTN